MTSFLDLIVDESAKNLQEVPPSIIAMTNLKMLYLSENNITTLQPDFFTQLPNLTWLDLRNNGLKCIPLSIANHQSLENLLVSNNSIEALPMEVGLVPNLKVLQLGANPLVYPKRDIVDAGTQAVCAFLRKEYEKAMQVTRDEENENKNQSVQYVSNVSSVNTVCIQPETKPKEECAVASNSCTNITSIPSILTVKSLSGPTLPKIVHRISKSATKTTLQSFCNLHENMSIKATQTSNVQLSKDVKEEFFERVKVLLAEQEKILQQEKNLRALDGWHRKKKSEPMRYVGKDELGNVPFATNPAYNTILSRKDLSNQIERMIDVKSPPHKECVQKLINDLSAKLKNMEMDFHATRTNREEIDVATKQIKMITDIHKKLLMLQENNQRHLH